MQQLMTKEIEEKAPALRAQDGKKDPTVYAHFFSCFNGWDWYLTEYDAATGVAFGFVSGFADEWGYFSIPEFVEINKSKGINVIERDEWFAPKAFSKIKRY